MPRQQGHLLLSPLMGSVKPCSLARACRGVQRGNQGRSPVTPQVRWLLAIRLSRAMVMGVVHLATASDAVVVAVEWVVLFDTCRRHF